MTIFFWLRYIVRSIQRSGRRVAFALTCITVGVASVVALQLATLTVQNALTQNVRAANGGDISVVADEAPLSATDLGVFRRLQQQGKISAWTPVATLHATAQTGKHGLVPFDVNIVQAPPYPLGGQPTFVTPAGGQVGHLLVHHGDVLVTSVLRDELGVGVGSTLVVNSIGGRGLRVTVRGVLAETNFSHAAVMTVDARDGAVLNTGFQRYSAVYIDLPGAATGIAQQLRNRFPIATVQTVQESLQTTQSEVHDFRQFMLLVGLMALLIAGIGILNAVQSMLTWRRLEIAMIKAVGFRAGTLYALFGGEAVIMGIMGGIIGAVVGALASQIITNALARALAIQVTFVLDVPTILGGVALGIGATLIFALLPIVRAAGLRPLELLREGAGTSAVSQAPQTAGLLVVVLVLFAALAAAIMGNPLLAAEFVVGAAVACGILMGLFAVLVTWMARLGPPHSRAVGLVVLLVLLALSVLAVVRTPAAGALLVLATALWAVTISFSTRRLLPLLIAVRSLSRRRARTSVTLVAFLTGVLAMSITLTVALSLQNQINQALSSNGSTNLVAVGNSASVADITRAAAHLPGVKSEQAIATVNTRVIAVAGRPLAFLAPLTSGPQNPDDAGPPHARLFDAVSGFFLSHGQRPEDAVRFTLTEGRSLGRQDAGTAHVLVRRELKGAPYFLKLGSTFALKETGSGTVRTATVVGFYSRPPRRGFGSFFAAPILGDVSFVNALGAGDAQTVVSFTINPSYLTADATALQHRVPGALVIDVADLTAVIEQILNDLLNLLAVITALALGAGVAVVANGVALAMLERRREIALYKAIGFGPGNVLRFVLVENALAGILAGSIAVLAVAATLAIISRLALDRPIAFDPLVAVLVLLGATALATVTAYLAARGPIGIRPIEVLRNE